MKSQLIIRLLGKKTKKSEIDDRRQLVIQFLSFFSVGLTKQTEWC